MQETLAQLRLEVAGLRASRKRLVLAADADRRQIERALHEGVQQFLVALAVKLQLADADPAAAKALIEEMRTDVQQALDEAAQLAQRIYPPLLEASGLAPALRAAAATAGVRISIEVDTNVSYPPEIVGALYLCVVEALEHASSGGTATVVVRDDDGALAFEVVADGTGSDMDLDRLHDRIEALGGRITIASEPGRGARLSGSLPLARRR